MEKFFVNLLILTLTTLAQAKELAIKAEVFATGEDFVLASELVAQSEVPPTLYDQLQQLRLPVNSTNDVTILDDNQVSRWLRAAVATYNHSAPSKLTLLLPQQIKIHKVAFRLNPANLNAEIKRQVQARCATCEVEVELGQELPELATVTPWTVHSHREHWQGRQLARLTVGGEQFDIPVNVRWFDRVVVAAKNLASGQVVASDDLTMERRDVTFVRESYLTEAAALVGQGSTRDFRRGDIINRAGVKKMNIVAYGQAMTATFAPGPYAISIGVIAKGVGAAGDTIPVVVSKTQKKLMGKIIAQDKVRIE